MFRGNIYCIPQNMRDLTFTLYIFKIFHNFYLFVRLERIELSSLGPKSRIIPLYHNPILVAMVGLEPTIPFGLLVPNQALYQLSYITKFLILCKAQAFYVLVTVFGREVRWTRTTPLTDEFYRLAAESDQLSAPIIYSQGERTRTFGLVDPNHAIYQLIYTLKLYKKKNPV